jgi:hypothetical protein
VKENIDDGETAQPAPALGRGESDRLRYFGVEEPSSTQCKERRQGTALKDIGGKGWCEKSGPAVEDIGCKGWSETRLAKTDRTELAARSPASDDVIFFILA